LRFRVGAGFRRGVEVQVKLVVYLQSGALAVVSVLFLWLVRSTLVAILRGLSGSVGSFQYVFAAPTLSAKTYPFGLQRAELSKGTRPKGRSIWHMNSVTLDWMDLAVILSTFVSCAVVGWFAACLVRRFETVEPMEPVAPVVDVQQIEVTVVDRGWRRWRRKDRIDADSFQGSPRKILSLK
jgi:hypothetical protein